MTLTWPVAGDRRSPVTRGVRSAGPADRLDLVAYLGVCALYATIPWQDVVQVSGIGTVAKAVGLLVIVVCGLALGVGGGFRRPGETLVLMLLFTGWLVLSPLWSAYPQESFARGGTMLQLAVMVLLTVLAVTTPQRLNGLLAAFVVGDLLLGISALQQRAGGPTLVRYTAEGTNPNDVAFLMCLGIPMAWYLAVSLRKPVWRAAAACFPLLAVFVVLLTASRSALLLLLPAFAIVPLTIRLLSPTARTLLATLVLVVMAGVVSGGLLLPSAPLQRLGTTWSELQSGTLDNRTVLWGIGLDVFEHHQVIGVGAGVVPEYVGQSYPLQAGVHNTYLSVAVQLGTVGILLFGLLLMSAVRHAALVAGRAERAMAVVLGVVLVLGLLPRHWEFSKGLWAVLAILVCIAATGREPRSRDG